MVSKADKNVARLRRHKRVRGKISGTPERPRLDVFRSNMHIYAQIIDDVNGVTLCAASSVEKAFTGNGGNKEAAHAVGKLIAERAAEKGITCLLYTSSCRRDPTNNLKEDTKCRKQSSARRSA